MNAAHPPEEHFGLQSELSRLARENEALRESARLWIRMYERRLARSIEDEIATTALRARRGHATASHPAPLA